MRPAASPRPSRPPVLLEEDVPLPQVASPPSQSADPSISPATVTTLTQELRPATPSLSALKAELLVNDSDFGFRIEAKLRAELKELTLQIEAKERRNEDLNQEILSRKRLAKAISVGKEPSEAFFKAQIQARDRQIAILSDRLFTQIATSQRKAAEDEKSSLISGLQAQISTLNAAISQLQTSLSQALLANNEEVQAVRSEKEQLMLLQEALQEELEAARLQVTQRERTLRESKSDLSQLAKIVSEMTGLNKELNEKVEKSNREMERINAENFQNRTRVENVELLEAQVQDLMRNKVMYEQQFEKMTLTANRKEEDLISLQSLHISTHRELESHLQTLSELSAWEEISETAKTALVQLHSQLQTSIQALGRQPQPARATPELDRKITELKVREKEQVLEIEELKRNKVALEAAQTLLKERIGALETELVERREDFGKYQRNQEAKSAAFREEIELLKMQNQTLSEERNSLELALAKAQTHATFLMERTETDKQTLATAQTKTELADKQVKAGLSQLLQVNKQLSEREKEVVESRKAVLHAAQRGKVMEQELWSKDTEVITSAAQLVALEEEFRAIEKELERSEAKSRRLVAERVAELQGMLEERDEELRLLKGMLRSVQVQLKQKDVDLLRYKRKIGELPSESHSPSKKPSDSPTNKGQEEAYDIVQSFLSQIERLRRFKAAKEDSIAAAATNGSLSSQWLKEELKLAKAPGESLAPSEVLRMSLEQRLAGLIGQAQSAATQLRQRYGATDLWIKEAAMSHMELQGGEWLGLAETLSRYGVRVLGNPE